MTDPAARSAPLTTSCSTSYNTPYTAWEYRTVQAPRDHESLYRDTCESFGWTTDETTGGGSSISTLRVKRDRAIPNRAMLEELERRAEAGLRTIDALERSRRSGARSLAVLVGILGTVLLAGSVFLLDDGRTALAVLLGVLGLLGWLVAHPLFRVVSIRRATVVAPLVRQQLDVVHDVCAQASRLRV